MPVLTCKPPLLWVKTFFFLGGAAFSSLFSMRYFKMRIKTGRWIPSHWYLSQGSNNTPHQGVCCRHWDCVGCHVFVLQTFGRHNKASVLALELFFHARLLEFWDEKIKLWKWIKYGTFSFTNIKIWQAGNPPPLICAFFFFSCRHLCRVLLQLFLASNPRHHLFFSTKTRRWLLSLL